MRVKTNSSGWQAMLEAIGSRRILLGSLRISLVVGTLLNLINLGPALLAGEPVSWSRFLLNYIVPFCVAGYSAARNELGK